MNPFEEVFMNGYARRISGTACSTKETKMPNLSDSAKKGTESYPPNFKIAEFPRQLAALCKQHEGLDVDTANAYELQKSIG